MSQTQKQILEQANAAVLRRDYDGFLQFCTDDTVWTFVGDKTLSGKREVREWMTASYRTAPPN